MASSNPYSKLHLNTRAFESVIEAQGGTNYTYKKAGNSFQLSAEISGVIYLIAVYENSDGTTTLSRIGNEEQKKGFDFIADLLTKHCKESDGGPFELSLIKVSDEHFGRLVDYLVTAREEDGIGAEKTEEPGTNQTTFRFKAPNGNKITIKRFTNKTVQFQGVRTKLASQLVTFLSEVLSFKDAVSAQLTTYQVEVTTEQLRDELEAKIPAACRHIDDVIKSQLASSIGLMKVHIALPDYGAVAFPALRGLEGFLWQELSKLGFDVKRAKDFGEYFEQQGPKFAMKPVQAFHSKEPAAALLAETYELLHKQRHSVAHIGKSLIDTRILATLDDARQVVRQVLDNIEQTCTKMYT
jgi:hypothetical protein